MHWTFSAASLQILFMLKQQHYTLTNVKKVKSQSTTPLIHVRNVVAHRTRSAAAFRTTHRYCTQFKTAVQNSSYKSPLQEWTKLHRWVWSGVFLTKQSKRKEKARSMAIISSLYKAYGQKDKRCAERYTIFQPRIKSWTSTIIWDKYIYIYFFLVNYVCGTVWCSRIWNSILSRRGQSLTLN